MEDNRKDRKTLKTYFQSGKVPTEEQFAELIDSVANVLEDGQVRTKENGWMIYPLKGGTPGLGFYMEKPVDDAVPPVWLLSVNAEKELLLKNEKGETVLSVSQDKIFTISDRLKVKDDIMADAFKGSTGITSENTEYLQIPADGKWHDLPVEATVSEIRPGCRAYRILACYRESWSERYRMTEAIAQHSDYWDKKISSRQKHWWGWSGGISLRWKSRDKKLYLQMHSKSNNFKTGIYYQITEVWNYTEK